MIAVARSSSLAFAEDRSGAHEDDQGWGVDGPPASLRGVDQLVGNGNGNPGNARPGSLSGHRSQICCEEVDWIQCVVHLWIQGLAGQR